MDETRLATDTKRWYEELRSAINRVVEHVLEYASQTSMLKNCLAQQNVSVNRAAQCCGNKQYNKPTGFFIFIQSLIVDKDRLHFKLFNEIQDLQIKKNILIWIYVSVKKNASKTVF